jgi:glucan phosphoethanolaminetransferase (alkaline phosphatase superfamily)
MNLHHKEHRLITIVGVILVVLTVIFGIFILNPLNLADQMVAISMNLLVIALILILTGFLVEMKYKMDEEKKHFLRTEKLLAERLRITDIRPVADNAAAEKNEGMRAESSEQAKAPKTQPATEKEKKKNTKGKEKRSSKKKKAKKATGKKSAKR